MFDYIKITKYLAIFSLILAQTSCYQGKLDPFDIQNGLTKKEIKDSIVKKPVGTKFKISPLLKNVPIPKTSTLIVTPPPPAIGGEKVISFSEFSVIRLNIYLSLKQTSCHLFHL